jgi:hypothetical protein
MGIVIDSPQPLRNCPTLPVWQKRRGQVYLVFIDETFLQFFELNSRGYFCHAAVGIPEVEYAVVRDEMRPIFERYCEVLVPQKEFKHTEFKRIDFEERTALANGIHDALYTHGGFISGFYTPADSFLMEKVRVTLFLAGREVSIPADHKRLTALMNEAATELKAAWTGPGMSDIIITLLYTPVSGLLHFAEAIDAKLKVIYDPRERKEDKAVKAAIERIAELVGNITPATARRLLDVNNTSKSDEEIGLQLADLAAGETRAFLDANRDLREFGASPKLITPTSDEPIQTAQVIKGAIYKAGTVTIMPNALQRRFFRKDPKGRSVLPQFTDLLLSGMLTCFSTWGTPRHILPYDRQFVDQLD